LEREALLSFSPRLHEFNIIRYFIESDLYIFLFAASPSLKPENINYPYFARRSCILFYQDANDEPPAGAAYSFFLLEKLVEDNMPLDIIIQTSRLSACYFKELQFYGSALKIFMSAACTALFALSAN